MKEYLDSLGMRLRTEDIYRSKNDIFCMPKDKVALAERLGLDLKYGGILLGRIKAKRFFLSIGALDLLESDTVVTVDDKGEWFFLCGKDIFQTSIIKKTGKGRYALVKNRRNEVLGMGKVIAKEVKNIMDKGDYLRRERR